jgi:hypothetical protein
MALTQVQAGLIGNSPPTSLNSINVGVPIVENNPTISTSYAITTGTNAMSAGPITVADGVVITVTDGSVWTIV